MALAISEAYQSRPFVLGKSASRTLLFNITGADPTSLTEEEDVQAILVANAPGSYQGLALEELSAEPQGNGFWIGTARYVRLIADYEYTFQTAGGSQKITQSLGTTIYPDSFGIAPDFGGVIGVTIDSVEGVDITTPVYQFTETHYFSSAAVTLAYKLLLFNLTGKMNNATFKGFAAGECLFLGANGSVRPDEQWAITFTFACSPNVSGLDIGDISGIDKRGWDYLWIRYEDEEDHTAFTIIKRPFAAYVEQVYELGDFSTMGIGT